jgi:serine/threonine protein kinase
MHKDIKPENILLHGSTPIIADFGMSKLYHPKALTGFTKSTFQYHAPEQIAHVNSSMQSDVFALGSCFLLVFAAAIGGSSSLDTILDIVETASCQYARELERLRPPLREMVSSQPYSMQIFGLCVHDMLLEIPDYRPTSQGLEEFLEAGPLFNSTTGTFVKDPEASIAPDIRKMIKRVTQSSSFTQSIGNCIYFLSRKNFFPPLEIHFFNKDENTIRFPLTMDMLSTVDLISPQVLAELQRHDSRIATTRLHGPITLSMFNGNSPAISEYVKVRFKLGRRKTCEFSGDFLVLNDDVMAAFGILLGVQSILKIHQISGRRILPY